MPLIRVHLEPYIMTCSSYYLVSRALERVLYFILFYFIFLWAKQMKMYIEHILLGLSEPWFMNLLEELNKDSL